MIVLTNPGTADLISLISSSTSALDVHATHIDATVASPPVPDQPSRTNTAISTAATTTIVSGPASGKIRALKTLTVRNKGTANNDVTINHNIGGTLTELFKVTLRPADVLEYIEGVGFYVVAGVTQLVNHSTAAQGPGFAADTYLTASNIAIPSGMPVVGTTYRMRCDITKTALGTATPILIVRFGTAGSTADAARCTFTFGPGTAVADTAFIELNATFRSVGSGTSAVLVGTCGTQCLPATGWSSTIKAVSNVSGGFDSTVANSIIGVSYNGGASASHTVQQVVAELIPY